MKKISRGFGLLEAIVAVAAIAVVSTVGYTTYQNHMVRTQEEVAKHDAIQFMGEFQQAYVKKGAFSDKEGNYPEHIENEIYNNSDKSKYFLYEITPSRVKNEHQHVCVVVYPKPDTIISDKVQPFVVDNFGKTYSLNNMPDKCLGFVPEPKPPAPECTAETPFEVDALCYCNIGTRKENDPKCTTPPEPTPPPAACLEAIDMINGKTSSARWVTKSDVKGNCTVSGYDLSGQCNKMANNVWAQNCKDGTCNTPNILNGKCGANANCNNLLACVSGQSQQAVCEGNCNGSGDIWVYDGDTPFKVCKKGCQTMTVHYPRVWESKFMKDGKFDKSSFQNAICDNGKYRLQPY